MRITFCCLLLVLSLTGCQSSLRREIKALEARHELLAERVKTLEEKPPCVHIMPHINANPSTSFTEEEPPLIAPRTIRMKIKIKK